MQHASLFTTMGFWVALVVGVAVTLGMSAYYKHIGDQAYEAVQKYQAALPVIE
jgi:hypothetical protein